MTTDIEKLRREERNARREGIYNHPNSVRRREAEKRGVSPNHLGARQADQRNELGHRQREEGKKLSQEQQVEMDRHKATGRPMPADLPKQAAAARKQLTEKHERERQQLQERHLRERSEERRRSSK